MDGSKSQSVLEHFLESWAERALTGPEEVEDLGRSLMEAERVVVITGTSISGLVLAARLGAYARSEPGLRIVLVAGSPPVPRRLIAGCSLRYGTIRRMAAAMSVADDELIERFGGRGASFRRLAVARAEPGSVPPRLVRRRTDATNSPYVGLSTRHGQILAGLRASLSADLPISLVDGDVAKDTALDGHEIPLLARGKPAALAFPAGRTVVLNATSRSDLLRPGRRLPDPARYVVAVQAPLRPTGGEPWCGDDVGMAPMTFGPPAPHLAFFTPFRDVDTPEATWYGINTMTLAAAELEAAGGPEAVTQKVWKRLEELEAALGFAEIDPDETRGGAVVPVVRDKGTVTQLRLDDRNPVVDVHRSFTSGAPAINVDGMLAATVGADTFASAFCRSAASPTDAAREALVAADRALGPVRWRNWATEWLFFRAPEEVRSTAAHAPYPMWKAFVTDFARLRSRIPPRA
jgi:hypothetical protein